jgi:riboflavin biosynthesis pyrimidine reductase
MEIRLATNEIVRTYLTRPWPKAKSAKPAIRINMVVSFDGKINVIQPKGLAREKGLGSNLDQYMMKVLRTRSDMVLVGANTLRAGAFQPLVDKAELALIRSKEGFSAHPVGAVVSRRGADLPLDNPFFNNPDYEGLVFVWESAPKANIKKIEATGREVITFPDNDFKALAEIIRKRFGVERLLVEGGAEIVDSFIKADLVDEFYQTIAYKIVSGSNKEGITTPVDGSGLESSEAKLLTPLSMFYVPETNELFQSVRFEN